jgi:HupE / UreJ protein
MSETELYLRLGFAHITDWQGYDHMLFLLALVAGYALSDWRRVLVLVTAFTVGHSLTLALTALEWIKVSSAWIELLIPMTILLSAVGNLFFLPELKPSSLWLRYGLALAFGLVHGMGFSSYFRSLLGSGGQILQPLLWFNCGIEIGQLLIVTAILGIAYVAVDVLKLRRSWWRVAISVLAAASAGWLIVERVQLL